MKLVRVVKDWLAEVFKGSAPQIPPVSLIPGDLWRRNGSLPDPVGTVIRIVEVDWSRSDDRVMVKYQVMGSGAEYSLEMPEAVLRENYTFHSQGGQNRIPYLPAYHGCYVNSLKINGSMVPLDAPIWVEAGDSLLIVPKENDRGYEVGVETMNSEESCERNPT